jgi:hypothetical protein
LAPPSVAVPNQWTKKTAHHAQEKAIAAVKPPAKAKVAVQEKAIAQERQAAKAKMAARVKATVLVVVAVKVKVAGKDLL